MGKKNKNRKVNPLNLQRQSKNLERRTEGLHKPRNLVFGLAMMDRNQSQNYEDWEEYKLLSKALSRIQELCSMTANEAKRQQIIKEYGTEIPDGSSFKRPKHIPEDITWASIRIQGKERIIGYLENNYIFRLSSLIKGTTFTLARKSIPEISHRCWISKSPCRKEKTQR